MFRQKEKVRHYSRRSIAQMVDMERGYGASTSWSLSLRVLFGLDNRALVGLDNYNPKQTTT